MHRSGKILEADNSDESLALHRKNSLEHNSDTRHLFDKEQERALQLDNVTMLKGQEQLESKGKTEWNLSPAGGKNVHQNCDNRGITDKSAGNFSRLGKKADSMSVKDLKSELSKRGQEIYGTKKGRFKIELFKA